MKGVIGFGARPALTGADRPRSGLTRPRAAVREPAMPVLAYITLAAVGFLMR
jgi:hypothetical protein